MDIDTVVHLVGLAIPVSGLVMTVLMKRSFDRLWDERLRAAALRQIELDRERELERQRAEEREKQRLEQEQRRLHRFRTVDLPRLLDKVRFLERKVQVGTRKTGERAVGMLIEEIQVPADDMDVRPIGSPSEVGSLLPSEFSFDPDTRNRRILMGEALIRQDLEHIPVMEPVYEPVWETRKQVLYVLLDVSGSMYDADGVWKIPLWKAICHGLLDRAVAKGAVYLHRDFHDVVSDLFRADDEVTVSQMRARIEDPLKGSGTKISNAIFTGISDLAKETYDKADIVIVTDGEDDQLDVENIRDALAQEGIGLHAILIGVENKTLRNCSDLAQNVNRDLSLGELTDRSVSGALPVSVPEAPPLPPGFTVERNDTGQVLLKIADHDTIEFFTKN